LSHEQTAKLFPNGRSQAVRLPAPFRFQGDQVFIRRNPETGEVVLSPVPSSWDSFFSLRETLAGAAADFLADRHDVPPRPRAPLDRKTRRRR
jgi:antitoxin VapB